MKTTTKILVAAGGVVIAAGVVLGYSYLSHTPRAVSGTEFEGIDLSGSNSQEIEVQLSQWWDAYRNEKIDFSNPTLGPSSLTLTLHEVGVQLDVDATKAKITFDSPLTGFLSSLRNGARPAVVSPVFRFGSISEGAKLELKQFVSANARNTREARAFFRGGSIVRVSEIAAKRPDFDGLAEQLARATSARDSAVEIPLAEGRQRVPDSELNRITHMISEFSTKFDSSNAPRTSNIRIASEKLNGVIVMPGDRISFNEAVGRRTRERGFRMAGVFSNGRLDEDIGGGICQVSSTLYNAVLLADLKIVRRQNHSMPVPYLSIGRDAAVAFPWIDLVFENNQSFPVAMTASVVGGTVTFRMLGPAEGKKDIEIVAGPSRSWPTGTEYVEDPSLDYGVTRVLQRATGGHNITMFRVVRKNGEVVRRESLGLSHYRGGKQIVARNSKATPPVKELPTEERIADTTDLPNPAVSETKPPPSATTTTAPTATPG